MIEKVDLTEFKKKKDILFELQALGYDPNERYIRKEIEKHNIRFNEGQEQSYIIHSVKGYKATTDYNEIYMSLSDLDTRSKNMLWKLNRTKKELERRTGLSFDLKEDEVDNPKK